MMTTAARWPEGVPKDNDEMIRMYGRVIMTWIYRLNVVRGNAEDHFQTVCLNLVRGNVLERFVQRVLNTTHEDKPDTMTALEACDLLGITFSAFRTRQYHYHKNFVERLGGKRPANHEGDEKGSFRLPGDDRLHSWVAWMPTPIEGDVYSRKGVYRTSDILDVHERSYFKNALLNIAAWPVRKVKPHHFQAYLLMAVRNHFFNACRTIRRKQQDRLGDYFSNQSFHTPEGEYNENWEDNLSDVTAPGHIEASTLLREKLKLLACITKRLPETQQIKVMDLLNRDYSIREVVEMVSLAPVHRNRLLTLCEA